MATNTMSMHDTFLLVSCVSSTIHRPWTLHCLRVSRSMTTPKKYQKKSSKRVWNKISNKVSSKTGKLKHKTKRSLKKCKFSVQKPAICGPGALPGRALSATPNGLGAHGLPSTSFGPRNSAQRTPHHTAVRVVLWRTPKTSKKTCWMKKPMV